MRSAWFTPLAILATLGFGVAVLNRLPERVPIHWNAQGRVDGWTDPLVAVLSAPVFLAGFWLLMLVLPRIDPRRRNYPAFRETFMLFVNAVTLFLATIHVGVLGHALGWDVSVPRVIAIASGIMLAVMGNELGRVQPNWFVGIRTPWTLSDPEVWRRTHRVGGRVFVLAGLVIVVAAALLPEFGAFVVLIACALGAGLGLTAYSYLLSRRLSHGHA
jgi:uncharacterized membrane protein